MKVPFVKHKEQAILDETFLLAETGISREYLLLNPHYTQNE
jgi:hypothetical protein